MISVVEIELDANSKNMDPKILIQSSVIRYIFGKESFSKTFREN